MIAETVSDPRQRVMNRLTPPPDGYVVAPLDSETWPAFARLVERHNGVWGGCWCMEFHPEGNERGADRRAQKEQRVSTRQLGKNNWLVSARVRASET
jgi:hypothetical protein